MALAIASSPGAPDVSLAEAFALAFRKSTMPGVISDEIADIAILGKGMPNPPLFIFKIWYKHMDVNIQLDFGLDLKG
jgi:hypothetical protein